MNDPDGENGHPATHLLWGFFGKQNRHESLNKLSWKMLIYENIFSYWHFLTTPIFEELYFPKLCPSFAGFLDTPNLKFKSYRCLKIIYFGKNALSKSFFANGVVTCIVCYELWVKCKQMFSCVLGVFIKMITSLILKWKLRWKLKWNWSENWGGNWGENWSDNWSDSWSDNWSDHQSDYRIDCRSDLWSDCWSDNWSNNWSEVF